MKCPMLTMYAVTFSKPEAYMDRECLKEECAWWGLYRFSDKREEDCCSIAAIALALSDIMNKMCKGGKYGKNG